MKQQLEQNAHIKIATCDNCKSVTVEYEPLNLFFCTDCPSARREGDDMSAIETIKREDLSLILRQRQ